MIRAAWKVIDAVGKTSTAILLGPLLILPLWAVCVLYNYVWLRHSEGLKVIAAVAVLLTILAGWPTHRDSGLEAGKSCSHSPQGEQ